MPLADRDRLAPARDGRPTACGRGTLTPPTAPPRTAQARPWRDLGGTPMPRDPRYLPPGWSVEVTTRTICGFYLLPATPHFARVMVGVLARAQEKYPVKVHAAVAASNHYHLILTPEDVDQLGDFMDYVQSSVMWSWRHSGQESPCESGGWDSDAPHNPAPVPRPATLRNPITGHRLPLEARQEASRTPKTSPVMWSAVSDEARPPRICRRYSA